MTDNTESPGNEPVGDLPGNRYQFYHEADEPASLSETIVTAIADLEGVDAGELDPLYDRVDPDCLNAIFRPADGASRADGRVCFSMAGYDVTVRGSGHILIDAPHVD